MQAVNVHRRARCMMPEELGKRRRNRVKSDKRRYQRTDGNQYRKGNVTIKVRTTESDIKYRYETLLSENRRK